MNIIRKPKKKNEKRMNPVKVLIVGCGGREVAIAKKISESNIVHEISYIGTYYNPQLVQFATNYSIIKSLSDITVYDTDLCIFGPEQPLGAGQVDKFPKMKCIGPPSNIARLESDKKYCRNFLSKYGLSKYSPKYFDPLTNQSAVLDFITRCENGYVIKPVGLCSGKGVKVSGDHLANVQEGLEYMSELKAGGTNCIIEEKLIGREFSCMSLTDGRTCVHFPIAVDFKRAYNGDKGPNTGGMGCVTYGTQYPLWITPQQYEEACKLNETVVNCIGYENDQQQWAGVIFGGFMLLEDGSLKLLEYNMRFGDPECIGILAGLSKEVDMLQLFLAAAKGTLGPSRMISAPNPTCTVYVCPKNYPEPSSPIVLPLLNELVELTLPTTMICAGMRCDRSEHAKAISSSSRTFAIVAVGLREIAHLSQVVLPELEQRLGNNFRWRTDMFETISHPTTRILTRTAVASARSTDVYAKSGVSIESGNEAVASIQNLVRSTHTPNVVNIPGGFGAVFKPPSGCLLVSSTDSVGSKSELIRQLYGPRTGLAKLGHDLVNHHVNDILAMGCTQPLFFLDYFATDKIEKGHLSYFIEGVSEACKAVGCALVGGETAEIPALYQPGAKDLVGFIVGSVAPDDLLRPHDTLRAGDICIALPSVSAHTNGYTLINKIYTAAKASMETGPLYSNDLAKIRKQAKAVKDINTIRSLAEPHKCYLNDVKALQSKSIAFKAIIHITGGGLIDNPPRVLPPNGTLSFSFKRSIIQDRMPYMFRWLWNESGISEDDYLQMYRIFNCGIGLILVVDPASVQSVLQEWPTAFEMGLVVNGAKPEVIFE